jgi:hypothetical protein
MGTTPNGTLKGDTFSMEEPEGLREPWRSALRLAFQRPSTRGTRGLLGRRDKLSSTIHMSSF